MLTGPTDTGSGGYTHKFFRVARSREDVIAPARRHRRLGAVTYGWMGRSPTTRPRSSIRLGANAAFYGKFADNAGLACRAQETCCLLNHAIVNPPVDRQQGGRSGEGRLIHDPEGD